MFCRKRIINLYSKKKIKVLTDFFKIICFFLFKKKKVLENKVNKDNKNKNKNKI